MTRNKQILNLLTRSFREGSIQLWRNKFLSGSTILLGTLILFLLNFIFAIQFFADHSVSQLQERADFLLPLHQDYDAFTFDALGNELKMYDLQFDLRETQTLKSVTIPPRLHLQFGELAEVQNIFEIFDNPRYESVIAERDIQTEREFITVIDNLFRLQTGVRKAAFLLTLIFVAGGILLVMNAFQLVLFSRKDELQISKLVGADFAFIMGPFLWEGFLFGLISSMLAITLFVFALREMTILPGGEIFIYLFQNVFSLEMLISGLVGAFGAWVATRRYLVRNQ